MKFTLRFLLVAAMALTGAWAQQKTGTTTSTPSTGGASTGGSTGTGSNPGNPGGNIGTGRPTSPVPTNPTQQTPTPASPSRPIFLSGTVAMDDGSPLPGSVNIQAICGAEQKIVTHTSAKGDFNFQWGENSGIFEDASQTSRTGSAFNAVPSSGLAGTTGTGNGLGNPLANCELKVDLGGYTSSRVGLYNYSSLDRFDVGTLILHRITGDEGTTVSVLSMKAPKDAKKSFEKGNEQFRAKKFRDAQTSFEKAVAAYPQYADAWLNLGRTEMQLGTRDTAREHFQKAMDLDKKLLGPWQELGYLSSDESKWEDAARYLDQAVRLDPMSSAMTWYFSAMANYNLGRFEAAERSIRSEIKLDQDRNPRARFLLGIILMARNDMEGGAEALRNYLKVSPTGPDAEIAKKQLIRAEGLARK